MTTKAKDKSAYMDDSAYCVCNATETRQTLNQGKNSTELGLGRARIALGLDQAWNRKGSEGMEKFRKLNPYYVQEPYQSELHKYLCIGNKLTIDTGIWTLYFRQRKGCVNPYCTSDR